MGSRVVRHLLPLVLGLMASAPLFANSLHDMERATSNETTTAWKRVLERGGVVICSRRRADSPLPEFRGEGEIAASPGSVFAVVNDPEAYPGFMPYTKECRILQRMTNGLITYQRLDLPLVSDRDYTLRSVHSKSAGPAGTTYRIRWEQANGEGPAPKPGVQRIEVCEGSWLIEPAPAGKTRVTYMVRSGTGGSIPAFLAESGRQRAIWNIFDAIRKEVREPKYANAEE